MLERVFKFRQNGTTLVRDTVAGLTTFMVMAYIIFVNPSILGFSGVPDLQPLGLPFAAALASTCLVAGVMTLIMGLVGNKPYAIAPGMGLSGLRKTFFAAIPLQLKQAIVIGIGFFILFIGLVDLWKMKNKKAKLSVTPEHYYTASAWITQNATTPQVVTLKANVWPTIIVGNVTNKLLGGKAPKHPHLQILNFDTYGKADNSYKLVCTLQPNENYKMWCSASGFVRMHKWVKSKPVANVANARHLNFRMAPK